MFELMVSITQDKQALIHDLYLKLSGEVKKEKGIIAEHNYNGRATISVAVPEKKKEYYKSKILDHIIFIIIDEYKFNYYKENLQILGQNVVCQSFLKAISIFDADIDKEVIKQKIELKGEVLVDSFYYFRLGSLKARWAKTANIINQNQVLSSLSSMLGVLKYLTMTSENLSVTTEVSIGKKQIKMKGYASSKCFKRDFEGHSNFLTEIVRLNPVKINLKVSEEEGEDSIAELLSQIFADKIYFVR